MRESFVFAARHLAAAASACVALSFPVLAHAGEDCEAAEGPLPDNWEELSKLTATENKVAIETINYPAPDRRFGAGPAVNVRRQPQGVLSGRIVFTSGGHGWNGTSGYSLDRPVLLGMNEDYGNIDQMNFFAQYCWNAGATVVPLRPVGQQVNTITLDQDMTTASSLGVVQYTGTWSTSAGTPFYSVPPDSESYRFAAGVLNSTTATARYIPNITVPGYYPVYTWVRDGSDRIRQEYIIKHAGGITSTRIPHNRVGKGFVWLGTYYFDAGSDGYVEITNNMTAGETAGSPVVIADAIRFGNGIGGSGRPREEEGNLHWGKDVNKFTFSFNNVSGPPLASAYMNNSAIGALTDRIYIGFHSNASNGSARGAVGLHNNAAPSPSVTPHQVRLAELLGREINEGMAQLDTIFFPTYAQWSYNSHTYSNPTFNYGELSNGNVGGEMDATIIEVAFHDNASDAQYMRDPVGRRMLARHTMDGMIRYFAEFGGGALNFPPDEPRNLRALNADDTTGDIVLSWDAPNVYTSTFANTPGPATGHAPTKYAIYTSNNGREFKFLAETTTTATTHRVTSATASAAKYYYVTGVNAGGESFPSNVAGATSTSATPYVLIVDGFDRNDELMSPRQSLPAGTIARVIPQRTNNFSYVVQHGNAIAASSLFNTFDSVTNEAVINNTIDLSKYKAVVWFSGKESTRDETFNSTEQTRITNYINAGGHLFVSGSELGWDLDQSGTVADRAFFNSLLGADYVSDDANNYTANGQPGTIFEGISLTFDDGTKGEYNADTPDTINPFGGSTVALKYGSGTNAATHYMDAGGARGQAVVLAFPFETIVDLDDRNAVMASALQSFAADSLGGDVEQIDEFSFAASDLGWNFVSPAPFTAPAATHQNGALRLQANGDNTNTFGFWVSTFNALQIEAFDPMQDTNQTGQLYERQGPHYMVRFWVRRTTAIAALAPELRVRVNSSNFQDYHTLEKISVGDTSTFPSTSTFTPIDLLFHPHPFMSTLGDADRWYYIAFDLLNFGGADDTSGAYEMQRVEVFKIPYQKIVQVADVKKYDLGTQEQLDEWQFYQVPPYNAPVGVKLFGRLQITAVNPDFAYGNFQNMPFTVGANLTGQSGKLFLRMTSEVTASEPNPQKVPHIRTRIMPQDFNTVATSGAVDDGDSLWLPYNNSRRIYRTYLEVPPGAASPYYVHTAFDLLSFESFASEPERLQKETSQSPIYLDDMEIDLVRIIDYPATN